MSINKFSKLKTCNYQQQGEGYQHEALFTIFSSHDFLFGKFFLFVKIAMR